MQNNNNLYFSQQPPAGYTAGPSQNPLFSNQQHVQQQQHQQQQPFTFPAMSTSHPLPPPIPPLPPQHHHHQQQQQQHHHHQQSYSSTQGLMMPPPNSSSSTPSAPTAPINPSSSSLAPVLFDNSMPVTDDDASWSLEDIENLKELLDQGERAKWKYIASELTKERNKRITTQACQKKFKDMFGVAEASSPLGSSLAYVVSPDGWACLGDDYTPRTIQAPKNMAHLHSDDDDDDDQDNIKDYSKSSPASSFSFNSAQSLKKQSLTDSPLTNIPQQQFSYSKPATPSTASFPKPLESTSPYHFQNHQQPLPTPTQPYIMTSYPQYPYTGVPFSNYQPQPYTTTPNTTTANTTTTNNNNTNNTNNNNNNSNNTTTTTTTTTTGNTTTAANPSTSAAGYGYNNYGSYNNYNASGYYNQVPQPPAQPYQRSQQQPPPTLPPPVFATAPGKPNGEPAQSDDQAKPAIQQVLQPPESPSSASHTKLESIINS